MSERKKKNDAKKAEKTAENRQKRSKVQHLWILQIICVP